MLCYLTASEARGSSAALRVGSAGSDLLRAAQATRRPERGQRSAPCDCFKTRGDGCGGARPVMVVCRHTSSQKDAAEECRASENDCSLPSPSGRARAPGLHQSRHCCPNQLILHVETVFNRVVCPTSLRALVLRQTVLEDLIPVTNSPRSGLKPWPSQLMCHRDSRPS